jgi:hypothetical protein
VGRTLLSDKKLAIYAVITGSRAKLEAAVKSSDTGVRAHRYFSYFSPTAAERSDCVAMACGVRF